MSTFNTDLCTVTDVCLHCFVDKQYTHTKKQVCVRDNTVYALTTARYGDGETL